MLFDFKCCVFNCVYKYRNSGSKGLYSQEVLDTTHRKGQFTSSNIVDKESWTSRDPNPNTSLSHLEEELGNPVS